MPRAEDYDRLYARARENAALASLDHGVVGRSVIAKFECTGYLDKKEQQLIRRTLIATTQALPGPGVLLDLGCGTSLFGCWMAQQLRFDLVGVDFSEVAVRLALKKSKKAKPAGARFIAAPFEATGLPAGAITAVMSVDALYLASHPGAALDEIRRVAIRGAPLVYSYYSNPSDRTDWPRLTRRAGFERISVVDSSDRWRRYMRRKHGRRWRHREALRRRLGHWADAELAVTRAMLGLDGRARSFISDTSRHIVFAVRA